MATTSSGAISLSAVNSELGYSSNTTRSMGQLRFFDNNSNNSSGPVTMSNMRNCANSESWSSNFSVYLYNFQQMEYHRYISFSQLNAWRTFRFTMTTPSSYINIKRIEIWTRNDNSNENMVWSINTSTRSYNLSDRNISNSYFRECNQMYVRITLRNDSSYTSAGTVTFSGMNKNPPLL
jgi:hypothetical protein